MQPQPLLLRRDDTGSPDSHCRRNLSTVLADTYMRDVLLWALHDLQAEPYGQPGSYFQLSRIHGLPYEPWDGVPASNGQWCHHKAASFLQWHRAYLRQFEQELERVAKSETCLARFRGHADETQFREAALALRLPYLDWTSPELFNNGTFTIDTVSVVNTGSAGGRETIANPLASFRYPRNVSTWRPQGAPVCLAESSLRKD